MRTLKRTFVTSIVIVLAALSFGDIAPTTGTFRGIYHRDRSGVGRFSSMIVHKSLSSKLDKYDGKFIEVEVTKGNQPMNPGPAIMLEVGKITELPAAPISITVVTLPSKIGANAGFQVLAKIHNNSDDIVNVWPGSMRISTVRVFDNRYSFSVYGSGYEEDMFMSMREYSFLSAISSVPGRQHLIIGHPADSTGSIPVRPGESYPFVLVLDEGLAKGEYEAEVNVNVSIDNKSVPVSEWLKFDINGESKASPKAKSDLSLKMSDVKVVNSWRDHYGSDLKTNYKWFFADITLENNGSSDRRLPQHKDWGDWILWQGRVLGWSSDGRRIPLTYYNGAWPLSSVGLTTRDTMQKENDKYEIRTSVSGFTTIRIPWRLGTLSASKTAESEIRFRTLSYFPDNPIVRITCDLLTDQGLETFVLADSFDDKLFVNPPAYGPVTNGVKCRIRTEQNNYKRGDDIAVFLGVVDDRGRPVSTIKYKDWENKWTLEIDGKKIDAKIKTQERGTHVRYNWRQAPQEHYFYKIDSSKLFPGKHTIRVYCDGDHNTLRDKSDSILRRFRGKLNSNSWTFNVGN